jgi:hypothetical protein
MTDKERNAEAAAPTRPLVVGGTTYLISQPTPSHLASIAAVILRRTARDTPLSAVVNDPSFKLLPLAAQVEVAREAARLQASGGRSVDGLAIATQLLEPDVLAFAIWLLARPNHPDLKLEAIRPHVSEGNAVTLAAELTEASGMASLGSAGGPFSPAGSPG